MMVTVPLQIAGGRAVRLSAFVVGAVACAALAGCGRRPEATPSDEAVAPPVPWTADMQAVSDGNNKFAIDLYKQLAEKLGNVFVSPYSVHAALAMTATGARGGTRDEMLKTMHLPDDAEKLLGAGDVGRYFARGGKGYELSTASALWGQNDFPWRPEFLDPLRARFAPGYREADFKANPEAERVRINGWAEGQTRGKIKDLLPGGVITPSTRVVLANAVYFKGVWADRFDPRGTEDAPFTKSDGTTTSVPLMHRTGLLRLHADAAAAFEIAEFPYRGDSLSLVVLLPASADGLPELEKRLSNDTFAAWLVNLHYEPGVRIYVPKIRIECAYGLADSLKGMGMPSAFDPHAANFSGMHSGGGALALSAVIHKAFVEIGEEGTEAAAATALAATGSSAVSGTPSKPPTFRADHPFLFLIRDTKTGTILFLGRFAGP